MTPLLHGTRRFAALAHYLYTVLAQVNVPGWVINQTRHCLIDGTVLEGGEVTLQSNKGYSGSLVKLPDIIT